LTLPGLHDKPLDKKPILAMKNAIKIILRSNEFDSEKRVQFSFIDHSQLWKTSNSTDTDLEWLRIKTALCNAAAIPLPKKTLAYSYRHFIMTKYCKAIQLLHHICRRQNPFKYPSHSGKRESNLA
jgi:hypothetical protein